MSNSQVAPGLIRIGDAERQDTVDRLAQAHALGQLEVEEFHERVEQAQGARNRDDLDAIVRDLPGVQKQKLAVPAVPTAVTDRVKAAGSLLASMPRKVWVIAAVALTGLMVAGFFLGGDGPGGEHGPRGEHGPGGGGMGGNAERVHDVAPGGGFFTGVLSMLGVVLLVAGVFFVVRKIRARKAAAV